MHASESNCHVCTLPTRSKQTWATSKWKPNTTHTSIDGVRIPVLRTYEQTDNRSSPNQAQLYLSARNHGITAVIIRSFAQAVSLDADHDNPACLAFSNNGDSRNRPIRCDSLHIAFAVLCQVKKC